MILAERAARLQSEARAAQAEADLTHAHATASSAEALIARLRLEIEKLRRTLYGVRSERKERFSTNWRCSWRTPRPTRPRTSSRRNALRPRPSSNPSSAGGRSRKPFPEHLPRERVVIGKGLSRRPPAVEGCDDDRGRRAFGRELVLGRVRLERPPIASPVGREAAPCAPSARRRASAEAFDLEPEIGDQRLGLEAVA